MMTSLLVIKVLPAHSRGDLAIAKGMLETIKTLSRIKNFDFV